MTPYYQDDLVTIYHGDCREWMTEVQFRVEGLVDVIVTDPPYGELGYEWDSRPDWGTLPWSARTLAMFGHQPALAREALPAIESRGLPFRYEWVWEKPIGRLWNHQRPIRRHELVWVFGDITGTDLRPEFGGQHDSIISAKTFQAYLRRHPEATGHPTQKPVSLMRAIVSAMPPGTVLDPFMGSGSTLVAARELSRRAIGIEIDEKWCEIAAQRCSQEVLGLEIA